MRLPDTHARRAFTLIELLVVVTIIVLLMAIGFGVARAVKAGAKERIAETLCRSLDTMLDEYVNEMGKTPAIPKTGTTLTDTDVEKFYHPPSYYAAAGPTSDDTDMPVYGVSAFLDQVRGIGSVDAVFAALPQANITRRGKIDDYIGSGGSATFAHDTGGEQEQTLTVVDSDNHELFYIHPKLTEWPPLGAGTNHNAAKRFGATVSGRPYFMAIGSDGFAGDLSNDVLKKYADDNVFSSAPDEYMGPGEEPEPI
ncbi:MAG: type II secretion system protein [Phycisphaerales bacterium]|nr:type II secretion system protein [Phycisphaerales bacterium]